MGSSGGSGSGNKNKNQVDTTDPRYSHETGKLHTTVYDTPERKAFAKDRGLGNYHDPDNASHRDYAAQVKAGNISVDSDWGSYRASVHSDNGPTSAPVN